MDVTLNSRFTGQSMAAPVVCAVEEPGDARDAGRSQRWWALGAGSLVAIACLGALIWLHLVPAPMAEAPTAPRSLSVDVSGDREMSIDVSVRGDDTTVDLGESRGKLHIHQGGIGDVDQTVTLTVPQERGNGAAGAPQKQLKVRTQRRGEQRSVSVNADEAPGVYMRLQ